MTFKAEPEKRAFLADFAARVPDMITQYGIKPNPTDVSKGWETLPAGWDRLRVSPSGAQSAPRAPTVCFELMACAEEAGLGQEARVRPQVGRGRARGMV